ncbi:hypothetical protein VTL71DRAFT_7700 [Oculimacula yallundae]|uniref:Uncharacterized protein n=1 Tax=Oculimacula yallundae TaxID=86028 RepID=A0ABR4BVP4_9HELO
MQRQQQAARKALIEESILRLLAGNPLNSYVRAGFISPGPMAPAIAAIALAALQHPGTEKEQTFFCWKYVELDVFKIALIQIFHEMLVRVDRGKLRLLLGYSEGAVTAFEEELGYIEEYAGEEEGEEEEEEEYDGKFAAHHVIVGNMSGTSGILPVNGTKISLTWTPSKQSTNVEYCFWALDVDSRDR